MLLLQPMVQLRKAPGAIGQEIVHRHFQTLLSVLYLAQQFQLISTHYFSRRGRRWCTHIRYKIGDSDIGFMTNGTHDGYLTGKNRSCDALVVKAPEIFQRSAAASDN
ncbi:hypothetical protein D3C78_908020 [compost metagenome]